MINHEKTSTSLITTNTFTPIVSNKCLVEFPMSFMMRALFWCHPIFVFAKVPFHIGVWTPTVGIATKVTICTSNLESIWILITQDPGVKFVSTSQPYLMSMPCTIIIHMVKLQKFETRFFTAKANPAIMSNHLLFLKPPLPSCILPCCSPYSIVVLKNIYL